MLFRLALITVTLIQGSHYLNAQQMATRGLKERASLFYRAWQKEDPKTVWDLLSPKVREEANLDRYISNLKKFFEDTKLSDFTVVRLDQLNETDALVETNLTVFIASEGKKTEAKDTTKWVLVNGETWFLAEKPREAPSP